jgi:hypothetical protein
MWSASTSMISRPMPSASWRANCGSPRPVLTFSLGLQSALLGAVIVVVLGAIGVAVLLKGHGVAAASERDAGVEVSAA